MLCETWFALLDGSGRRVTFESTTNLRPRVGSPLHNRVYDGVDTLDVYGQPRNRGGLVDIGAVEARE